MSEFVGFVETNVNGVVARVLNTGCNLKAEDLLAKYFQMILNRCFRIVHVLEFAFAYVYFDSKCRYFYTHLVRDQKFKRYIQTIQLIDIEY